MENFNSLQTCENYIRLVSKRLELLQLKITNLDLIPSFRPFLLDQILLFLFLNFSLLDFCFNLVKLLLYFF